MNEYYRQVGMDLYKERPLTEQETIQLTKDKETKEERERREAIENIDIWEQLRIEAFDRC